MKNNNYFREDITFDELLDLCLTYKHLRKDSKDSYRRMVSLFTKAHPGILVSEITKEVIFDWRNKKLENIKPTTWNSYMRHCRTVLNFGIENDIVSRSDNPFCHTFLREPRKKRKIIKDQDINTLINFLTKTDNQALTSFCGDYCPIFFAQALIFTFLYTGMRRSQLLKLQIQHINLDQKTIFIPHNINKNHDDHIIPISSKLYPYIKILIDELNKKHLPPDAKIFNINHFSKTTKCDGDMTKDQLSYFFRKISKITHISLSSHRFRHTLATSLMKKPEQNLYGTQKLLGHKDIKVTLSYIEYDVNMLRQLVDSI
ncbi:tyrosine-type recombinase/integrase [Gallibacterium anatis]|uniref:tyrosine-type recombinase/integrase n=1 Tax=Gallibacterium anatis TaxID=750 RepID=UPI00057E4F73|nr:site-specific integrase [Gallibacterium anatis]